MYCNMRRRFFYSRLGIPSNEIWYTSLEKIALSVEDGFGTTLISNKYYSDSTKGILTFESKVSLIPDSAFYNQPNLTSIILPDSVTEIGSFAFYGCSSLTGINIPDSVTEIGDGTFLGCIRLTSITIPNSVTSIGDGAFRDCTRLTSITIPNSVTSIGEYTFYDCRSLTSITIPDSVTEIGYWAFYYCKSLTSVYCKATTPPALGHTFAFDNNGSGRKIYVPYQSLDAYKTATYWSEYADDIVGYDFENDTVVGVMAR